MEFEKKERTMLARLIKEAVKDGDYSSQELGALVKRLLNLLTKDRRFVKYTDDWKAEMFSNACWDIYSSLGNIDCSDDRRVFNYVYTTALNAFRRTIRQLNFDNEMHLELLEESGKTIEPFYLRNKRRLLKGRFESAQLEIIANVQSHKPPRLFRVVGRTVRTVRMNRKSLETLIKINQNTKERFS